MGLTSSLFAGLSGMKTNEFRMDVIGNNIANVNTYAFKSSRASFQTQFSQTFSFGTAPNGPVGGTNPMQVGTGSAVGSVMRDFAGGAPETTGRKTDLAVQGQGMFIVQKADGSQVYTRDGSFQFDAENYLLTADGNFLQGYGVDANFSIVEGTLSKIRIPIGEITTAATTTTATFSGDLNAEGIPATDPVTGGPKSTSVRPILDSRTLGDGAIGTAIAAGTLMINLVDATGNLVQDGNIITLDQAIKGGQTLPEEQFTIDATTTVGDFTTWLQEVLGINTSTDLPNWIADGVPNPGVVLYDADADTNADTIRVVGNTGNHNALTLGNQALKVEQGTAAVAPARSLPFDFATTVDSADADIASVRTSFQAYDSLGIPLTVDLTMVMESKDDAGVTWRYFGECTGDSDTDRVVGTGTIKFDNAGHYLEGDNLSITIDHNNTGSSTPQTVTLDFSNMNGFAQSTSTLTLLSQDGFQAGTLQDFSVGADGIIVGSFTNGLTRNLGQVVLATFRNYEGLVALTDNLYSTGPNSGNPIVKKPQELGAGSISAAALELSNVDLSREFINLIVSSTGFSASSRVIQTSDRLLTELMALTR